MRLLLKLTSLILIQAVLFNGSCFAGKISFSGQETYCLSPQLTINSVIFQNIYTSGYQQTVPKSEILSNGLNHKYEALLIKLTQQIGTADKLLQDIKNKYPKYSDAIRKLEEFEKHFSVQYWVIEHEKEVMLMSYAMGKILGFGEQRLTQIVIAARFHDIGKCQVNPEVINDDRLFSEELFTEQQRESIRNEIVEHSAQSYQILREVGIKDELMLDIVFYHHANVDGSGYPDPVTRQEIPLEAKITRVADSFSAMLGKRPYIPTVKNSFEDAIAEIKQNDYYLYGPRVVRAFLKIVQDKDLANHYKELYLIPLKESKVFHALFKQAQNIPSVYPFAKVACGISRKWNEQPYAVATNTIGTHRHAEMNLILKVLGENLRAQGLYKTYLPKLRRLEFLSHIKKINESEEALAILQELSGVSGRPFKNNIVYITMRPCAACLELFELLEVKGIYFGSEHPDQKFIAISEKKAAQLRGQGIKIAQAHFVHEGVIEPNRLFFSFCRQPGYETITATINNWFADFINHDDESMMSINTMNSKQREFTVLLNSLLWGIREDTDLTELNKVILVMQKLWNKERINEPINIGVVTILKKQLYALFLSDNIALFGILCKALGIDSGFLKATLQEINQSVVLNKYAEWIIPAKNYKIELRNKNNIARQIKDRDVTYQVLDKQRRKLFVGEGVERALLLQKAIVENKEKILKAAGFVDMQILRSIYGFHGFAVKKQGPDRDIDLVLIVKGCWPMHAERVTINGIERELHLVIIGEDKFLQSRDDDTIFNKMATYRGICIYGIDYFQGAKPSVKNTIIDSYMTVTMALDIFHKRKNSEWKRKYRGWLKVVIKQMHAAGIRLNLDQLEQEIFTEDVVFFKEKHIQAREKIGEFFGQFIEQAKEMDSSKAIEQAMQHLQQSASIIDTANVSKISETRYFNYTGEQIIEQAI